MACNTHHPFKLNYDHYQRPFNRLPEWSSDRANCITKRLLREPCDGPCIVTGLDVNMECLVHRSGWSHVLVISRLVVFNSRITLLLLHTPMLLCFQYMLCCAHHIAQSCERACQIISVVYIQMSWPTVYSDTVLVNAATTVTADTDSQEKTPLQINNALACDPISGCATTPCWGWQHYPWYNWNYNVSVWQNQWQQMSALAALHYEDPQPRAVAYPWTTWASVAAYSRKTRDIAKKAIQSGLDKIKRDHLSAICQAAYQLDTLIESIVALCDQDMADERNQLECRIAELESQLDKVQ